MHRFMTGFAVLLSMGPAPTSAEKPATQVAVIEQAEIKVGTEVLETVPRGMPLQVRERRGEWLAVANGHSGWIHRSHVLPLGEAIDHFSEAIEGRPDAAGLYVVRGVLRNAQGHPAEAIADFSDAIDLNPRLRAAYANRAIAWKKRGEYAIAIRDYNEAIRLDPDRAQTWHNRGNAWIELGRYDKAISDFREAVRLNPEAFDGYNALAWVRATCPDEQFRDAESALENAQKACRLCDHGHWYCLGTLAAAHAAAGHFDEAVEWANRALDRAPSYAQEQIREELSRYESKQPYRDAPEPGGTLSALR